MDGRQPSESASEPEGDLRQTLRVVGSAPLHVALWGFEGLGFRVWGLGFGV